MLSSKIIGVIGGGTCTKEIGDFAETVGEAIAQKGGILICGGLSGVMEAACRGAKKRNGLTIGVLPGNRKSDANQYVDIALPTGMGEARNIIIVRSAHAVIAIDGEYGTLSEIAFCLRFSVPVVGLQTWNIDPAIIQADDPIAAVDKAFELAR